MAKERFDGARMASTLNTLEGYYDNFYSAMQKMDLAVNINLNVTSDSASYGKKASDVLELWNDNCSVFKNYYYVFKELTASIIKVFENNAEFEKSYQFDNETLVSYGEVGEGSLDTISLQNARIIAALMDGKLFIDGERINTEVISNRFERIVIDGNEFIIEKDENGNYISVTNVETGEVKRFNSGTLESQIQNMYDLYNSGKISDDDWKTYCDSLTMEEKGILDCIMTNAFVVSSEDASSIISSANDSHYLPLLSSEHTGKELKSEMRALFIENLYELEVLSDYKRALEADSATAEALFDAGYISEETYLEICEINDSKMVIIDEQMIGRSFLNNSLIEDKNTDTYYDLILDAIHNGDIDQANQYILELNSSTSNFLSLEEILSEDTGLGSGVVVDIYANRGGFGDFGIYENAARVSKASGIKQTTFIGAYEYATNTNQTYVKDDCSDIVYFSSSDYIEAGEVYHISSHYTATERDYLGYMDTFTIDSVPGVKMDSVYIKSLDSYCTVEQLNIYMETGLLKINEDGIVELGDLK